MYMSFFLFSIKKGRILTRHAPFSLTGAETRNTISLLGPLKKSYGCKKKNCSSQQRANIGFFLEGGGREGADISARNRTEKVMRRCEKKKIKECKANSDPVNISLDPQFCCPTYYNQLVSRNIISWFPDI